MNGDGDLSWDSELTIRYVDDVLYNCIPETYLTLLTSVTPLNSTSFLNQRVYTLYILISIAKMFSIKDGENLYSQEP